MNEFILKAMRYVDNSELFTREEMVKNRNSAEEAGDIAAILHDCVEDTGFAYVDAIDATAYAAYAASYAADIVYNADDTYTDYAIDQYFKTTGENKQDYIDEVERLR